MSAECRVKVTGVRLPPRMLKQSTEYKVKLAKSVQLYPASDGLDKNKIYNLKVTSDLSSKLSPESQIEVDVASNQLIIDGEEYTINFTSTGGKGSDVYRKTEESLIAVGQCEHNIGIAPSLTTNDRIKLISKEEENKRGERTVVLLEGPVKSGKSRNSLLKPKVLPRGLSPRPIAITRTPIGDKKNRSSLSADSITGPAFDLLKGNSASPRSLPGASKDSATRKLIASASLMSSSSSDHLRSRTVPTSGYSSPLTAAVSTVPLASSAKLNKSNAKPALSQSAKEEVVVAEFKPTLKHQLSENDSANEIDVMESGELKADVPSEIVVERTPTSNNTLTEPEAHSGHQHTSTCTHTSAPSVYHDKTVRVLYKLLSTTNDVSVAAFNSIQALKQMSKKIHTEIKNNTFDPEEYDMTPEGFVAKMEGLLEEYGRTRNEVLEIQAELHRRKLDA
jgi:hypothetical protein